VSTVIVAKGTVSAAQKNCEQRTQAHGGKEQTGEPNPSVPGLDHGHRYDDGGKCGHKADKGEREDKQYLPNGHADLL